MTRTAFVPIVLAALLGACASVPSERAPSDADAAPVACAAENQSCSRDLRCCPGTVCLPSGRALGDLCRRPMPATGGR
jgi:hypothetical protein